MKLHPALQKILTKTALPELLEILSERLNQSELTTLMLEVYRRKTEALRPSELLARLPQNRFAQPAEMDPIALRAGETSALKLAREAGFKLVELGPVTLLGSSSVYGRIHQNNVLSALRNCEVIADPSNLLCLLMSQEISRAEGAALHWFCSHRTLRTALFEGPGRYAHFQMLAACSLLRSRQPEPLLEIVWQHLRLQQAIFAHFGLEQLHLKIWLKNQRRELGTALLKQLEASGDFAWEQASDSGTDYYQGFQVKTFAHLKGIEIELADCGLVPWAAELKGDGHLQCLISGIGLERLLRLS